MDDTRNDPDTDALDRLVIELRLAPVAEALAQLVANAETHSLRMLIMRLALAYGVHAGEKHAARKQQTALLVPYRGRGVWGISE